MKSEKGTALVEVIVALALLGIIGVAFLSGLGTVSSVTLTTDRRDTAKTLAQSQMEYVKNQGYATSYTPNAIPAEYPGYVAAIVAAPLQSGNIQKITVTISQNGTAITTLEGYKMK